MDSREDPCADPGFLSGEEGPGPTARIKDPHMGPIHTFVHACMHTNTHMHVHMLAHTHTHTHTHRHMNVLAQADG